MERKLWKILNRMGWAITALFAGYLIVAFVGDFSGESIPEIFNNLTLRSIAFLLSLAFLGWKAWQYKQRYLDILEKSPNIIIDGFDKEKVPTTLKTFEFGKPKKGRRSPGDITVYGRRYFEQSSTGGTLSVLQEFDQISANNLDKTAMPGKPLSDIMWYLEMISMAEKLLMMQKMCMFKLSSMIKKGTNSILMNHRGGETLYLPMNLMG